ncbi:MAG: hypothetical protein Q8L48_07490 [Archangium sp.]|nr:hypothetical protein [Archangium sp.]
MSGAEIIDVTFVDADTGEAFLKLKYPARQVPTSEVTLGKDHWLVVEATPSAGALRLVLRKVQYVDPATILFSLPTVADVIPEEVTEGGLGEALRLHEDDWLQLELVPREVVHRAAGDLDAVKAVLAQEREGLGFKRLHLRKGLAAPFAARELRLDSLRALFGAERPVAYSSGSQPLKDCFAFPLPSGASLYGQASDGRVVGLGLTARDDRALGRLDRLTLIDWCAGEVYEATHG